MRKRRGFTLVELIVVIAVLTILLTLILPSLRKSRQSGITLLCANNLKQINILTTIYCQDNDRFPYGFCDTGQFLYPPPGGYVGHASKDWMGWWWFHFLSADTSSKGTLWCPARKKMEGSVNNNILCSNYGTNYSIAKWTGAGSPEEFQGTPMQKTRIRQPARTLLYMDSGYALISRDAATEGISDPFVNPDRVTSFYLPGLELNKNRIILDQQQVDAVSGRHFKRAVNVGFADGHVQKTKAERLLREQYEEGNGTNVTPTYIWLPGE